jgi:tRNA-binding protein
MKKSDLSYSDFEKLDLRVGTVVEAVVPEWSHWVMKLVVDFGSEIGKKTSFAGIMKFYEPKDLIGKQFPFVVNLKPKRVGPEKEMSEVMMLMVVPKDDEKTPPVLLKVTKKVPNGTKIR